MVLGPKMCLRRINLSTVSCLMHTGKVIREMKRHQGTQPPLGRVYPSE